MGTPAASAERPAGRAGTPVANEVPAPACKSPKATMPVADVQRMACRLPLPTTTAPKQNTSSAVSVAKNDVKKFFMRSTLLPEPSPARENCSLGGRWDERCERSIGGGPRVRGAEYFPCAAEVEA